MKSFTCAAFAFIALAGSGMAGAATPEEQPNGGVTYATDETFPPPDSYELHNARDAIEARAPVSAAEKARLKREAAKNRPGPDEAASDQSN